MKSVRDRKSALTSEELRRLFAAREAGVAVHVIAKRFGITDDQVFKLLRQQREKTSKSN